MAQCCSGEDEDKSKDSLEEALADFWGNISEEFKTEYRGDYETALNKTAELEYYNLNPWDRLLLIAQRDEIARLNIELHCHCPYLQLAGRSESFYYCHARANELDGNPNQTTFSSHPGQKDSAENAARLSPTEISQSCISDPESCTAKKRYDIKLEKI